jgi:hypothetical protein
VDRLSEFVEEHLKQGVKPAEMKNHLISNGWNAQEVDNAIAQATGAKTKKKILFAFVGVILVAILALVLISMTRVSPPPAVAPSGNINAALGQTKTPQDCSIIDSGMEKDECYKTLIKTGLDCETLEDNVEFTYCSRAYENVMLKGVDEPSQTAS